MSFLAGRSDEPKGDRNAAETKKPIPPWVPISLLAVTTAALALPIYLLRRHRTKLLTQSLDKSAPPARRNVKTTQLPASSSSPIRRPAISKPKPESAPRPPATASVQSDFDDGFNASLMGLKAFGLATLGVTSCAAVGIWGVKIYTGVHNIQEFSDYMRRTLLLKLPGLAARLHRPPDPDFASSASATATALSRTPWAWPEAEQRLRTAFDERGFAGWAEVALAEMEQEARVERARRGIEEEGKRGERSGNA